MLCVAAMVLCGIRLCRPIVDWRLCQAHAGDRYRRSEPEGLECVASRPGVESPSSVGNACSTQLPNVRTVSEQGLIAPYPALPIKSLLNVPVATPNPADVGFWRLEMCRAIGIAGGATYGPIGLMTD